MSTLPNVLSWSRFGLDILRSNSNSLTRPYRYFLVVTKSCQSRCQHCKIWQESPKDELTLEEITSLAVKSPWLKWLNISGGEPTDRADLPEIVAAFKKYCPDLLMVNFTTNGLRPEVIATMAKKIAALDLEKVVINVSIDGPKKTNDALRGIVGDFTSAVRTLSLLRKIPGIETKASMTLFEQNHLLIDDTIQAIREEIPDFLAGDLHLNIPHQSSHFYGNSHLSISIDQSIAHSVREFYLRHHSAFSALAFVESIYHKKSIRYLQDRKSPMKCAALQASVYISEKGEVYPCSIWDRPLGSLRNYNFDVLAVLNQDKAKNTRSEICAGNCPQCWTPCEAFPTILANVPQSLS